MTTMAHWTERRVEDFVHKISTDFVLQLEKKMEKEKISQKSLATMLGVSLGRVSQVLNSPGNLTLKKIVEYSRILGMKVAVVAYDDGDSENKNGPINSEIFNRCWQIQGEPRDFFSLAPPAMTAVTSFTIQPQMIALRDYDLIGSAVTIRSNQWDYGLMPLRAIRVGSTQAASFQAADMLVTEVENA